jgi:hypothetical protein
MKREVNMRTSPKDKKEKNKNNAKEGNSSSSEICTDPFGSWTGVPTDPFSDKPIQDVDDL